MRFGFGLVTCQRYPGDPRTDLDIYRQAIELAEECERLGLDSYWLSEHHFLDDAYMPALLPMAAAIAARTTRITVGTAVLLAPLYEPVRLAEDAATVDLVAGGRFVLGIGQGWVPFEFEALRIPIEERPRRFVDTIKTLRQAWSDGTVTGGKTITYPELAVTPKPARPGGPPLWIGAHVESAVRRAARLGDGFVATISRPAASFRELVGFVRDELEQAGRDPARFDIALHYPIFPWEGDDAWERVREHQHYVLWKYQDMAVPRDRTGPPAAPPPFTPEREEEIRPGVLAGRPEEVAAGIARLNEEAGGDLHFIGRLYWPGMDYAVQRESLRVYAERVIPALR